MMTGKRVFSPYSLSDSPGGVPSCSSVSTRISTHDRSQRHREATTETRADASTPQIEVDPPAQACRDISGKRVAPARPPRRHCPACRQTDPCRNWRSVPGRPGGASPPVARETGKRLEPLRRRGDDHHTLQQGGRGEPGAIWARSDLPVETAGLFQSDASPTRPLTMRYSPYPDRKIQ
jgi:hypothetical protein